jgi:hypothetical protein
MALFFFWTQKPRRSAHRSSGTRFWRIGDENLRASYMWGEMYRIPPAWIVALGACLFAMPALADDPVGMRDVPSSTTLECVDAAGHQAWCGPSPSQWHECRASGAFGRCPDDPACFDDQRKQVVCVRPVVPIKKP